ncbi:hypothetical protein D9M71_821690 [compost metagenome]
MVLVGEVAAEVVGLLRDHRTDAGTAADAGEVTIAQFAGLLEDMGGRVGIDGGRTGIGNQRCNGRIARLHVTGDDDDAVVGLDRQADARRQSATDQ